MQTLTVGSFIKACGFSDAFPLCSAMEYGQEIFNRCVAEKSPSAYAINSGCSIISDTATAAAILEQERQNFLAATVVEDGALYLIDGLAHKCKVHGPRFSDPIVFVAA